MRLFLFLGVILVFHTAYCCSTSACSQTRSRTISPLQQGSRLITNQLIKPFGQIFTAAGAARRPGGYVSKPVYGQDGKIIGQSRDGPKINGQGGYVAQNVYGQNGQVIGQSRDAPKIQGQAGYVAQNVYGQNGEVIGQSRDGPQTNPTLSYVPQPVLNSDGKVIGQTFNAPASGQISQAAPSGQAGQATLNAQAGQATLNAQANAVLNSQAGSNIQSGQAVPDTQSSSSTIVLTPVDGTATTTQIDTSSTPTYSPDLSAGPISTPIPISAPIFTPTPIIAQPGATTTIIIPVDGAIGNGVRRCQGPGCDTSIAENAPVHNDINIDVDGAEFDVGDRLDVRDFRVVNTNGAPNQIDDLDYRTAVGNRFQQRSADHNANINYLNSLKSNRLDAASRQVQAAEDSFKLITQKPVILPVIQSPILTAPKYYQGNANPILKQASVVTPVNLAQPYNYNGKLCSTTNCDAALKGSLACTKTAAAANKK